jgi:hypothetical protein
MCDARRSITMSVPTVPAACGRLTMIHRFWRLSRLMRRYDVDRPIGEGE